MSTTLTVSVIGVLSASLLATVVMGDWKRVRQAESPVEERELAA
jgi:hypothetical protein